MNNVPFPLIVPINEDKELFQGYIPINDTEYYIQIQLGSNCNISGEKSLLDLFNGLPNQSLINLKLQQATDIMSFLIEFKEILEKSITNQKRFKYTHQRYSYIYNELKIVGFERVSKLSNDLSEVILETIDEKKRKHLVKIVLPDNYPYISPIVSCELPTTIQIQYQNQLSTILSRHEELVKQYQVLFDCLDGLDQHMRILEPDQPKRNDCWRRIALGYHCTLEIEFNPEMPLIKPNKIQFFGNSKRVNDLKTKWNQYKWNKDLKTHENLFNIFQLKNQDKDEDYLNTKDIECGICYSYKLNDNNIPDVICGHELCNRGFHHQCLYEWLRGNPTTTQSFNVLFGKCPYCNEKITINAKLS